MINYYVVLEIPNFSDEAVIKKAYRTLSKKYHPDINKDPFATTYFLKINEAYDFLMDANKRMLLHQYLHVVANQASTKTNYTQSNLQKNRQYSPPVTKPLIHVFQVNKKHFAVNDLVLLQWNVSQCKAVHINVLGNVSFAGTHYLKMDHFADKIIILMTITGLDNIAYKYQIKLLYDNSNPAEKAFQKIKLQFPDVDEAHFKKETFFGMNARINKNEFKNRLVFLSIPMVLNTFLFLFSTIQIVSFLIHIVLLWVIFSQCYKRIHDIEKLKNNVWQLFIPLYNLFLVKELLVSDSEATENKFGLPPKQSSKTFLNWISDKLKQLNNRMPFIYKISFGSFALLVLLVFFKTIKSFNETEVRLTSHYIETSRPQSNGRIYRDYFVVFNDEISVNVTENDFYEILSKRKYDTYKIARNNTNEIQYVRLINSNTDKDTRINFGVLHSSNPLLLLISLLFLSQLYVFNNLTAPNELAFTKGYMFFSFMVYLYGIYHTIF